MKKVAKESKPIPKVAEHRLSDMFTETSSPSAKGNAARWYAEMIIDSFLSDVLKFEIGESQFRKLSLGEVIEKIGNTFGKDIRSSLLQIKDFGDKASHYQSSMNLTDGEAAKAVILAVNLFVQLAAHELKENKLDRNPARARILSTMLPSVREAILESLLDLSAPLDEYNQGLLHKYCLACTKNGKFSKARRRLDNLLKKRLITDELHQFEVESIKRISNAIRADQIPVPMNMGDCARNFQNVLATTSDGDRIENARLIKIFDKLLENISPSQMNHYIGDQLYLVSDSVS